MFNFDNGPCYRDLFPEPPPSSMIPSCAEGGVFGVLPGVIGALQATEAIKIILNKGEIVSGKLMIYDAELLSFRTLKFSKSVDTQPNLSEVRKMFEDNGWCDNSTTSEGEIKEPALSGNVMFNRLSMLEYQRRKAEGWKPFLIDVRSDTEYGQMKVSHTDLQVPHEEILSKIDSIPTNQDIIILCRSGMRSQTAAMYLLNSGYNGQNLYNLDGGIIAWRKHLPNDIE